MVKSEKQWQAEYDADTLAKYQEIMMDTKRRTAAMAAAKKKEKQLSRSLEAVKRINRRGK